MRNTRLTASTLTIIVALSLAAIAGAHEKQAAPLASDWRPPMLADVSLTGRLGATLPGAATFIDDSGARTMLSRYFSDKPAILVFSYFTCPMLCPLVLEGLARSLKPLSLQPGRDFDVIVISIDERDAPAAAREKKARILNYYGRQDTRPGWHFLTGDKRAIGAATQAAGFRYSYDEQSGQYAHAAALYVLTSKGEIARIFYGIDAPTRDLRLGLIEAAQGRLGTPMDQVLLYCYHYDPSTGKYGIAIMNLLRIAGSTTVLALGGFIVVMVRRERQANHEGAVEG